MKSIVLDVVFALSLAAALALAAPLLPQPAAGCAGTLLVGCR